MSESERVQLNPLLIAEGISLLREMLKHIENGFLKLPASYGKNGGAVVLGGTIFVLEKIFFQTPGGLTRPRRPYFDKLCNMLVDPTGAQATKIRTELRIIEKSGWDIITYANALDQVAVRNDLQLVSSGRGLPITNPT